MLQVRMRSLYAAMLSAILRIRMNPTRAPWSIEIERIHAELSL